MSKIVRAEDLCKEYPLPKDILRVFGGINFELDKGDFVAVMGVSGVGKTTLLNLLGALDKPTKGKIFIDGEEIFSGSEKELAELRNRKIGFVFQFYHLLPEFTALENVSFPLLINGKGRSEAQERALEMLREVSLEERPISGRENYQEASSSGWP